MTANPTRVPIPRFFVLGLVVLVAWALTPASVVVAQDVAVPEAKLPVLVTSIGQSLDAFQVQAQLKRAKVPYEYDAQAGIDKLTDKKTLFLAVGASLKGFGDAGISIEDELLRTNEILDAAAQNDIFIVVFHMGGADRRDALSNRLIEVAAPRANFLVIRTKGSDDDGMFTNIAESNQIPMIKVSNILKLKKTFQEMFATATATVGG